MPGMPDNVTTRSHGKSALDSATLDIKSLEKRILSSSEHLNEIISLNAIVQVPALLTPSSHSGAESRHICRSGNCADSNLWTPAQAWQNDSS